jgi:hypothetical protein
MTIGECRVMIEPAARTPLAIANRQSPIANRQSSIVNRQFPRDL